MMWSFILEHYTDILYWAVVASLFAPHPYLAIMAVLRLWRRAMPIFSWAKLWIGGFLAAMAAAYFCVWFLLPMLFLLFVAI